ncbi:MAG: hypothetical protein Fur0035_13270 [Anaerolineales bacterium]
MQNPLVSSILLLVAALVGYAIGVVARRKQDAENAQTSPAPLESAAPPAETHQPEVTAPAASPVPEEINLPGEHSALRVLIDKKLRWHLELDGQRLADNPQDLTPEQKQRLVGVIVQIRPWLEGKTAPAAAPAPAPAPIAAPAAVPAPTAPRRVSLGESFRAVLQSDIQGKKAPPPAILSVVSLIDDILQKNIAETPLAARKIKLEEGGIGEVMVWVGPTRYALEAVPDPEIKAAIQAAIAEFNQGK